VNLCGLPQAGGNEYMVDYSVYLNEIEDSIAAYLALNPTVAANVTTFLIGYNVPGYYTHAGTLCSVENRLMRYGQSHSFQFDNTLYSPATVERLTASTLAANNMHLAVRIDADTLARAKDILDRGLAVSAMAKVPAGDYLCSDRATLRGSLEAQHTRMRIAPSATEYAAFTIADDVLGLGTPRSSDGLLAVIAELATNAQGSLRSDVSEMTKGLLTTGYAAGIGFSALTANNGFDGRSFLEMLRIGGSFAEAVAVAVEHLDHTAVGVGDPTMTVNFELEGYDIYHGLGGPEAVDWASPMAYLRPEAQQFTVPLEISPGRRHVLAVRAVSSAGIEDQSSEAIAYAEVDSQGDLLSPPLEKASDVTAELQMDGQILVGFSSTPRPGMDRPHSFEVLTNHGAGGLDLNNPVASVSVIDDMQVEFTTTLAAGTLPALFAVRACKDARRGPISRLVTVRQPSPPAAPVML